MLSKKKKKKLQLLKILNDLSVKHLLKLILNENDLKLWKLRKFMYRLICDMFDVWDFVNTGATGEPMDANSTWL